MIKSKIQRKLTITLELDEDSARWLKGMVQNPLCENPSEKEEEIRTSIWNALEDIPFHTKRSL